MKKFILFIFLSLNSFLFSETFSEKQTILNDIQDLIIYEESIAKAYERYIITYYKLPTLTDTNFLKMIQTKNSSSNIIATTQNLNTNLNLDYGIKSTISNEYKKIYENNMYRDKTFVVSNKVYFSLENNFAKHIISLLGLKNLSSIEKCPTNISSTITCHENNTIYIDVKERKLDSFTNEKRPNNFLAAYTIENFENGPIIIPVPKANAGEKIFSTLKNGTLIYDNNGNKFIKTTDGIKELK